MPLSTEWRAPGTRMVLPWMVAAAWLVIAGILTQFMLAGLSMFQEPAVWKFHIALGFGVAMLVVAMTVVGLLAKSLRSARVWLVALTSTYVIQIVLVWITKVTGSDILLALHPFNGSLILVIALMLLLKLRTSSTEAVQTS